MVCSQLDMAECLHRDATWSHWADARTTSTDSFQCERVAVLLGAPFGRVHPQPNFSQPKAHDHSCGLERRSASEPRTLPSGSGPPSPQQSSVASALLLTVHQSPCQSVCALLSRSTLFLCFVYCRVFTALLCVIPSSYGKIKIPSSDNSGRCLSNSFVMRTIWRIIHSSCASLPSHFCICSCVFLIFRKLKKECNDTESNSPVLMFLVCF